MYRGKIVFVLKYYAIDRYVRVDTKLRPFSTSTLPVNDQIHASSALAAGIYVLVSTE
jgi:hypothetical protein